MNRKKIVCIGDSLTAGYGVSITHQWSTLLSNDLNIEVINSGISGDTSSGMLARFYEMAIKHNPTYIIITGGTNDISLNLPDNIIIANILAMTRYAKQHNIKPIIGIPTPFYNTDDSNDINLFINISDIGERIRLFQSKLREFALDDNQTIIDFSLNMSSDLFLEDGVHPNEKGHIMMSSNAKLILENIF